MWSAKTAASQIQDTRCKQKIQNAKGGCHQGLYEVGEKNTKKMTAKCHEAHNRKQNTRVR